MRKRCNKLMKQRYGKGISPVIFKLTVEASIWRGVMVHLSVDKTTHIRISHIDMIRTDVIDTAIFCLPVQVMDFSGIFV